MQKPKLWKVTDCIYLGTIDQAQQYTTLYEKQIGNILNLTSTSIKVSPGCHINCMNQPMSSKSFSYLMKILPKCVQFIDKSVNSGKKIAICCRDGYSRTLVILAGYYILKYNQDFKSIYSTLKSKVPDMTKDICPEYGHHLDQIHHLITFTNSKSTRALQ